VSKAREEAVAAAAAAAAAVAAAAEAAAVAAAKTEALERAMAEDGEGGSSGVAGPSGASEAAEAPDDYVCPITAEIMTDPVSTSDGFTYERAAISEWLLTKDTSPSTGAKLESKKVIPNLSLRSMIRSFGEDRAEAALRAAIASGGLSRARGTRGLV
jgi:E3 ubiquitin-protein ligase RGLG